MNQYSGAHSSYPKHNLFEAYEFDGYIIREPVHFSKDLWSTANYVWSFSSTDYDLKIKGYVLNVKFTNRLI